MQIDGKFYNVHRVSAWLWKGFKIASEHLICHSCDNPPCFNPQHLFVGSCADNIRDCWEKGRGPNLVGENNPYSKLTSKQVLLIRQMLSVGIRRKTIARSFGVSRQTIDRVANKQVYRSVA